MKKRKYPVSHRAGDTIAVDRVIASAGIMMEVLAKKLHDQTDVIYGDARLLKTVDELHALSSMLHTLFDQYESVFHAMQLVVPDGMVAIRVKNPLYEGKAHRPDEQGDIAEGNDDLFPF